MCGLDRRHRSVFPHDWKTRLSRRCKQNWYVHAYTTSNRKIVYAKLSDRVEITLNFILEDVLYVPGFTCNLISVGKLITDMKCVLTFLPVPTHHSRMEELERNHRQILNVAKALFFESKLSINFWGECTLIVVYLINYTPSQLLFGKTPYEVYLVKVQLITILKCLVQ